MATGKSKSGVKSANEIVANFLGCLLALGKQLTYHFCRFSGRYSGSLCPSDYQVLKENIGLSGLTLRLTSKTRSGSIYRFH